MGSARSRQLPGEVGDRRDGSVDLVVVVVDVGADAGRAVLVGRTWDVELGPPDPDAMFGGEPIGQRAELLDVPGILRLGERVERDQRGAEPSVAAWRVHRSLPELLVDPV